MKSDVFTLRFTLKQQQQQSQISFASSKIIYLRVSILITAFHTLLSVWSENLLGLLNQYKTQYWVLIHVQSLRRRTTPFTMDNMQITWTKNSCLDCTIIFSMSSCSRRKSGDHTWSQRKGNVLPFNVCSSLKDNVCVLTVFW